MLVIKFHLANHQVPEPQEHRRVRNMVYLQQQLNNASRQSKSEKALWTKVNSNAEHINKINNVMNTMNVSVGNLKGNQDGMDHIVKDKVKAHFHKEMFDEGFTDRLRAIETRLKRLEISNKLTK